MVAGDYPGKRLAMLIKNDGGQAELKTVAGEKHAAMMTEDGKGSALKDAKGNVATVTIADVIQSDGVIHVMDEVLMP